MSKLHAIATAAVAVVALATAGSHWRDHEKLRAFLNAPHVDAPPQTCLGEACSTNAGGVQFHAPAHPAEWPGLKQDQVISIGEALGGLPAREVVIACEDTRRCGALQHDLDDAFQIAGWPTTFRGGGMFAPPDGILVVNGDAIAEAMRKAGIPVNKSPPESVEVSTGALIVIVIGPRPKV